MPKEQCVRFGHRPLRASPYIAERAIGNVSNFRFSAEEGRRPFDAVSAVKGINSPQLMRMIEIFP